MAVVPGPHGLNNHHRNTLRAILAHPVGHNIEWRPVLSLLEAIATVEHRDGKVAVTIGSTSGFLDVPPHKDLDTETVVELRRMLTAAGYRA
jgi:hypothetical protein